MSQVNSEALTDLSTEEFLELSIDDIEELVSFECPEGLYKGQVLPWKIPNTEDNDANRYVGAIKISEVVELKNDTAEFKVTDKSQISGFYQADNQYGLRALRTDWADYFRAKGGGKIGVAMAQENANPGTVVYFEVEHRKVKDKDTGEIKEYSTIRRVRVAS